MDETYVKVSGSWRYVYRSVDQNGQFIGVFVSKKRNLKGATTFFAIAILWVPRMSSTSRDQAIFVDETEDGVATTQLRRLGITDRWGRIYRERGPLV